ncbi:MAG: 2-haloacid dehalogenase [Gammaproteobacteria bacterium]|jgi:2-haloacid dehalogenase
MQKKLTEYKALTFDCYGTLIDWESGIWDALQPLLMHNQCERVTRNFALQAFATLETRQERETPAMLYPELLIEVHKGIAAHLNLTSTSELDLAFGRSVPLWPAFADTADALRILKRHYKLVILSNVNRDGFAASSRKLGVHFDAIYTAEDVGSYKPNPANFDYMLSHLQADLGISHDDILHTAQSLHHDHVQAKAYGLANAWVDRQRLSDGGDWGATAEVAEVPKENFLFYSMMEMAKAVTKASTDS